jgi:Flp pilus assembly secretin CpaC
LPSLGESFIVRASSSLGTKHGHGERNRVMVRAWVVCAALSFANLAMGQVHDGPSAEPAPTVAPGTHTSVSACNEPGCPKAPGSAAQAKPVTPQTQLKQKLAELNCLQAEIDELRRTTGTPQQIVVKIQVLEVSHTKFDRLKKEAVGPEATGEVQRQISSILNSSEQGRGFRTIDDSATVEAMIAWIKKNNVGKVLAEPQIVAVSGKPASLHVGGELPLPGGGNASEPIQMEKFGTQVDLLANALGDNRVHLDLRVKVSDVDRSRSVDIKGSTVPALTVRQCDTPIELALGQTGVLSGLMEQRAETIKVGSKVQEQTNNVELVFLVTPESVEQVAAKQLKAAAALDTVRTADATGEPIPGEHSLQVTPRAHRTYAVPR